MVALYVASSEAGVGKTAICAGIGKNLLDKGKLIGFFKPTNADNRFDRDAEFIKQILDVEEPIDIISPVISDQNNTASKVGGAYAGISSGKDVVIVESAGEKSPGGDSEISEVLDAQVIIVEGYSQDLSSAINSFKEFGERLLGVVVNKVPENQSGRAHDELSAQFGESGITLLGVLPEDRVLFTLTVGELAEHLGGKILNHDEESSGLVENFMLGAMYVRYGPEYFGRKRNKAVVVRGERPDMQMAALETSTRCIVLAGGTDPKSIVLHQAREKKVPIISVEEDVITTVTGIEETLSKTRFHQEKKMPRLADIMGQHFNFQALYQGLGLAD